MCLLGCGYKTVYRWSPENIVSNQTCIDIIGKTTINGHFCIQFVDFGLNVTDTVSKLMLVSGSIWTTRPRTFQIVYSGSCIV